MKAYIITEGEYSDYRVVAVAINEYAAQRFIEDDFDPEKGHSKRGPYAYTYDVKEFDLLS